MYTKEDIKTLKIIVDQKHCMGPVDIGCLNCPLENTDGCILGSSEVSENKIDNIRTIIREHKLNKLNKILGEENE